MEKTYKTDSDYILDILDEEEERLLEQLGELLSDETKYLFYRYISVINTIRKLKLKTA